MLTPQEYQERLTEVLERMRNLAVKYRNLKRKNAELVRTLREKDALIQRMTRKPKRVPRKRGHKTDGPCAAVRAGRYCWQECSLCEWAGR